MALGQMTEKEVRVKKVVSGFNRAQFFGLSEAKKRTGEVWGYNLNFKIICKDKDGNDELNPARAESYHQVVCTQFGMPNTPKAEVIEQLYVALGMEIPAVGQAIEIPELGQVQGPWLKECQIYMGFLKKDTDAKKKDPNLKIYLNMLPYRDGDLPIIAIAGMEDNAPVGEVPATAGGAAKGW